MKSFTVKEPALLFEFLLISIHGIKRSTLKNYLKNSAVFVNQKPITQYNHPLSPGDIVSFENNSAVTKAQQVKSNLKIIFEDDSIIVINKPSGLLTIATETEQQKTVYYQAFEYLKSSKQLPVRREPNEKPVYIVHRLDKDASGVLVLAKNLAAKEYLQDSWQNFEKKYYAVVEGKPQPEYGEIRSYLKENPLLRVFSSEEKTRDSKLAITHYKTLKTNGQQTLLEVLLETGRKHQIRVHMALIGCPVLGDKDYGNKDLASRLALHAFSLTLCHPLTRKFMTFTAELPAEIAKLV